MLNIGTLLIIFKFWDTYGVVLEKMQNGGGKIMERALAVYRNDEVLFCSVVKFRNAYTYVAPMLISRNLSLNILSFAIRQIRRMCLNS
jgi:hypothetical protein